MMAQKKGQHRRPQKAAPTIPLPAEGESPVSLPTPRPGTPAAQVVSGEKAFDLIGEGVLPRLRSLEGAVGYPVISYFIEADAMADEQVLHLYEHLRRIGRQEKLGLWLSSRGGATEVPWKIVSLFREYCDSFAVLVPYRAHSSATLVCMGADELVLTPMSELGPIDPSRRHPLLPTVDNRDGTKTPVTVSVQDLRHVLEFLQRQIGEDLPPEVAAQVYTALFEYVHPLAIGALEQSWALANQIGTRILSTHVDDPKKVEKIVSHLADYYKSHLYQINRHEAQEIGLNVRDATESEASAMWDLYLAYSRIQFAGEAQANTGDSLVLTNIGHIDSDVGSTLGLGLALKSKPSEAVGSRWQSKWRAAPEAPSASDQEARPSS
jgi:hypothetical protein